MPTWKRYSQTLFISSDEAGRHVGGLVDCQIALIGNDCQDCLTGFATVGYGERSCIACAAGKYGTIGMLISMQMLLM
jgi:hypothetical protein